ncbi:MAG TPA: hypothetical protein DDW27_00985, partial [Bacteroidales bacterium]|nr:hypothetical protein [Bacteroidales bacterium]
KHHTILFDGEFVNNFDKYLIRNLIYSGGLNLTKRTALYKVYEDLNRHCYDRALNGIEMDGLFRWHASVPGITSFFMKKILTGEDGRAELNDVCRLMTDENDFMDKITADIEFLKKDLGDISDRARHLKYDFYYSTPGNFSGEFKVANHFLDMRIPGVDYELVKFAFRTESNAVNISEYLVAHPGETPDECLIQAYVISRSNGKLGQIPVRRIRPDLLSMNPGLSVFLSHYYKVKEKIRYTIQGRLRFDPPENNEEWFINLTAKNDFVNFSDADLLIYTVMKEEALRNAISKREMYMIYKIYRIEILNKLIKNGWHYEGI